MFNLRRFLAPLRRKPLTPYELALQSLARGEYAAALQQLDVLLEEETRGEERAVLSNKRGVALVSLLRRDEARQAFDDALAARPRYAPALVNLGNLHLEASEADAAIAQYQAAVAADDRYGPAHHNLAVAYKRLGRTADYVRELRRAHKLLN